MRSSISVGKRQCSLQAGNITSTRMQSPPYHASLDSLHTLTHLNEDFRRVGRLIEGALRNDQFCLQRGALGGYRHFQFVRANLKCRLDQCVRRLAIFLDSRQSRFRSFLQQLEFSGESGDFVASAGDEGGCRWSVVRGGGSPSRTASYRRSIIRYREAPLNDGLGCLRDSRTQRSDVERWRGQERMRRMLYRVLDDTRGAQALARDAGCTHEREIWSAAMGGTELGGWDEPKPFEQSSARGRHPVCRALRLSINIKMLLCVSASNTSTHMGERDSILCQWGFCVRREKSVYTGGIDTAPSSSLRERNKKQRERSNAAVQGGGLDERSGK